VATLRPIPLSALVRRVSREADEKGAIFDLPMRRFVRGHAEHDLSMDLGGRRASCPFGPAAGPHTQLAQNMVLSWLAGGRVLELKTVQVNDELEIPRPCIDMRDVGLNCEWSQELRVEQSLEEYVKGAILIATIAERGLAGVLPEHCHTVYDASVGYDLAGVKSAKVDAYLRALRDVRPVAERLLAALPADLRSFADVTLPEALVDTVTLSTFHGCPPSEIEAIALHLMETYGVGCVVKLNPTLLGKERVRTLLGEVLGYGDLTVPSEAFERDLELGDALPMIERLSKRARVLGLRFGAKLTNTLVVENRRSFFPSSVAEAYLSGPPLHVLAVDLLAQLRSLVGVELPISFSAGIDAANVADALALDLAPVTVCTDWLKTGGYARGIRYAEAIHARMDLLGARTREELVLLGFGQAERAIEALGLAPELRRRALAELGAKGGLAAQGEHGGVLGSGEALTPQQRRRWLAAAARLNTELYAARVLADPRYGHEHHERSPRKVGTRLRLFDCLTCDKCIPVCPNDANFTLVVPHLELPRSTVKPGPAGFTFTRRGVLHIDERHQIAHYADACNDCGNCDVFCPEDGGPELEKPRFFASLEALRSDRHGRGFFVEREGAAVVVVARLGGPELRLRTEGTRARFDGEGFALRFDWRDPEGTLEGELVGEVDLGEAHILHTLGTAVLAPREVNPVSCADANAFSEVSS
jgi:putative selenate reductase